MAENEQELRSLAFTPTWSVAMVLTIFVALSLLIERSIHRLSSWLSETNRKPLLQAVEKMKEELMLLGFISLLLTATSSVISNICIPSEFYDSTFVPCTEPKNKEHKSESNEIKNTCKKDYEPFVSKEGLEQLHHFIFVMAVTHISYSCLTMLLAIVKVNSWRKWENEARMDKHNSLHELTRQMTMRRQASFFKYQTSNPLTRNRFLIWVTCFFRQFGHSVYRVDYLMLRQGFITNHNISLKYDFHNYIIRSMEEEFRMIVGVSAPLWGFVVAFMLFNLKDSDLYFWIAFIPIGLVLVVGAKLQHIIATLALESATIAENFTGPKLKPRDDLFWFKKPQLLLPLIHFVLFQNAFELASFFWFLWQFGYNSCFIKNHLLVYLRLFLGFSGQFLCSYITLPLYALVTHMGTNYKAALISDRIRESIYGWKNTARRKKRRLVFHDGSAIHPDGSMVASLEEHDENHLIENPETVLDISSEIELPHAYTTNAPDTVANEAARMPLLRPSASVSSPVTINLDETGFISRSISLPVKAPTQNCNNLD